MWIPSINRIVIGIRIDATSQPQTNQITYNSATSQQAYRNFAEVHQPEKVLDYFMYLRLSPGEYDKLLAMDPKIVQANIIDYVTFLTNSDKCPLVQSLYINLLFASSLLWMTSHWIGTAFTPIKAIIRRLQKIGLIPIQKVYSWQEIRL